MRTHPRAIWIALFQTTIAEAYITSPGTLPVQRQLKWLKEMTVDICQAEVGQLSTDQLSQAPDLIYAWSHVENGKINKKECALAVESLMKRMIDERRAGNRDADLAIHDYNCLLEGWARSLQGPAAAERCEQILHAMQEHGPQPDLSSFKCTLMAWRQCVVGHHSNHHHHHHGVSYAPVRAQRILEWMIRLYRDGANPNALPDADCFDIVMQIWSRSGHQHAPEQTEKILGAMERLYRTTGFQHLKPRHSSFNAVLAAWSKSGRPEAADRAISILSFMELLAANQDSTIKPDSASYNTVMSAYAKCPDQASAARKADAILKHAEGAYQADPKNFLLETILFNTAMGAWAKSNKPGAYKKARAILDRQMALHRSGCTSCEPDVFSYTTVIASCAAESSHDEQERQKAFQVALQTYEEAQASRRHRPNHVTYGTMLKAVARLLDGKARRSVAYRIFNECCEAGCVGDMALSRLREAAPDVYRFVMKGRSKNDLPEAWTCHLHETNEYRKKKSTSKRRRAEV